MRGHIVKSGRLKNTVGKKVRRDSRKKKERQYTSPAARAIRIGWADRKRAGE